MRAFLLAAGKGQRLGKLTESTPKCLLQVGCKTMLEHWYDLFSLYNVTDVLINTHYLPDKVISSCSKVLSHCIKTTFVYEKELLGTGRTIYENKDFIKDERDFLVVFADTWMQVDLRNMLKFQRKRKGMGTIGLYRNTNLKDQGVVKVDGRKIVSIEEKPVCPVPNGCAFAGIMIGSKTMMRFYEDGMTDLVRDWLPVVKDGLNPYFIDGLVLDIGTPERYAVACEKVKGLGLKGL